MIDSEEEKSLHLDNGKNHDRNAKSRLIFDIVRDSLITLVLARILSDIWTYKAFFHYSSWLSWSEWIYPVGMACTVPYIYWYRSRHPD
ncbi:hypothetical protein ALMA_0162 [Alloscardovia macacae]|uniref:Uncharacterized protein n=1 Tax=Alloscardovia macacae TaxID=1160091 RepID=A0A261F6S4_9BIFI|nr:hypothetical protein ALMA_0162 [Alloscardovia macacae]